MPDSCTCCGRNIPGCRCHPRMRCGNCRLCPKCCVCHTFRPTEPISHCSGCNAEILWEMTPRGKRMPVDARTGVSHFATCPKAAKFRRAK